MALTGIKSILAWKIPWTKEPGRATVRGVTKSRTRLNMLAHIYVNDVKLGSRNGRNGGETDEGGCTYIPCSDPRPPQPHRLALSLSLSWKSTAFKGKGRFFVILQKKFQNLSHKTLGLRFFSPLKAWNKNLQLTTPDPSEQAFSVDSHRVGFEARASWAVRGCSPEPGCRGELRFAPEHAEGRQWAAAGQALQSSSSPVSTWACKTANTHGQDPATLLTRQQQNVLTRNIFLRKQRLLRNKL